MLPKNLVRPVTPPEITINVFKRYNLWSHLTRPARSGAGSTPLERKWG